MSIFEIMMLICFGISWPISIYKSYKSRSTGGKSVVFLYIVSVGYVAGILHKIFYYYDGVIIFYIFNLLMVLIDTALYYRNRGLERQEI
ncbi:MAG: hypothetical protein A4E71_01834 [Smithella sp. PtaU1.Bin162]|jgi:hypothetical protein|nr:MAG: hypothetical protein A4E71_01834 [Smithella sp. PtaU1.Bin162]